MTEKSAAPNAPLPAPAQPAPAAIVHSGESQWALVWREFKKRRLAFASVFVIVLLITVSICAPFLANDRPLYYRGYNRFEYRESLRTAAAVLGPLAVEKRPDANPPAGESKPSGDANANDAKAAKPVDRGGIALLHLSLMGEHLADDQAAALRVLAGQLPALVRSASAPDATAESRAAIKALIAEIQKKFDARNATFASRSHWPVFAVLSWTDVALLGFNISLILIPLWLPAVRRLVRPELPNGRLLAGCTILFVLPLTAGIVWKAAVPERIDRTKYKLGVESTADEKERTKAPVVFESVSWPPVPFALDEGKLDRLYLPPAAKDLLPESIRPTWGEKKDAAPAEGSDSEAATKRPSEPHKPGPWDKPHWLGTDEIGRDLLARMIWGGRVSLSVGIVATLIELILGVVLGAVAGYFRGWVDMIISRIIEIVICFPTFFLILAIVAFLGPSIYNIMLVIGLTGWTGLARLVRGEFLRLADQEFVLSARALGYAPSRIIFKHVLPNAIAPVLVTMTFAIAGAILIESGLSYLGFGITEPTPSWGGILSTARKSIFRAPWIIYFPGLVLFVTITAYNLVGEAFRDAADPRLRGRM